MKAFEFFDFSFIDIIDIALVALLLFLFYRLVKGTVAINIFIGIVIIYLIWKLTDALNMDVLSNILGNFISVGFFALIVVFQQEIRKFLLLIGSTNFARRRNLVKYFRFLDSTPEQVNLNINEVVKACFSLGQQKFGALLVIERNNDLEFVKNTGDTTNIQVNASILESIFYKNGPMHDGAVIIQNDSIQAARVVLPLSENRELPKRFGLRHRAALGVTEKTDALALVVSEQSGHISYVKNGEYQIIKDPEKLKSLLQEDLSD